MATQGIAVSVIGRSDTGIGRARDEDAFVISDLADASPTHEGTSLVSLAVNERGVLIAVSDGMGGAQAGDAASSMALTALRAGMSTVRANSADVALRMSVEGANQHVFENAQATNRTGMGATLTAVLFHGTHAHIAEVGDSRAYLLRGNRLVRLTRDQSYVQCLIDAGTLTPEQAKSSGYKNVILQAIGISASINVEMSSVSVRRQDRFLVCSDGLCGVLDDQMMHNVILGSASLESACAKLIETAVAHGSTDDITVILAEVGGEGAPLIHNAERLSLETAAVFRPA